MVRLAATGLCPQRCYPADVTPGRPVDRATSRDLIRALNRDAERIARRFRLRYKTIRAERSGINGHYGICYSDGEIRIRLRHAVSGRPLKYSSLVNTLCHELAHLRHFNHGERFKAFYFRLLDYARAEGIYRPGKPGGAPGRGSRTVVADAIEPERVRKPMGAARPRPDRPKPAGPEQLALF